MCLYVEQHNCINICQTQHVRSHHGSNMALIIEIVISVVTFGRLSCAVEIDWWPQAVGTSSCQMMAG